MGEWEKVSIPSFEEYAEKRAGEASRDAVLKILSQRLPNVPVVPAYRFDGAFPQNIKGLASLALGKMGVPDEYRTDLFGYEPNPETCIFTSTSKYGDKNAAVSGNETFRDNPGKYGFVSIPVGEAEAGDMFQFSNSEGIPKHAAIYTGEDEESAPLVSYSRGGTGPTTITPRGEEPTMAHDVNIGVVTSDIGKPSAYRYVGTKQKRKEWAGDYYNRYNPKTLNPNLPLYNFKDLEFKPFFKFHEGGFLEPKSAWDKLSMREKAEMMKVAVRNGIYNLNDIREKYNEFAGGGALPDIEELGFTNDASINPIPEDMVEDFAALASPTQQPKLENLKKKGYGFNVEDYAYRVKKFHPNVTEEQVKNAYINTPVIASDRNRGRVQGAYNYGDENGYGRRIMMYPSTVKDFQGVDKSGRYSKDAQLGHIYTHENSHNLHDQVKKELAPEEAAILKAAYGDIFNTNGLSEQDALLEMEAENTKNREILSKAYNNATKDKLTNVINKDASDKEIINNWLNSSGYTQDDNQGTFKKILFGPDGKPNTEKVKLMRDAMNFVAFNPYEDEINPNYAVFGGPLVQAANEYRHGGGIHIKPSHRGRLTELKKRTGKSEAELYRTGSPATRKMITFARSARKWHKHDLGGYLKGQVYDIPEDEVIRLINAGYEIEYL